MSAVSRERLNSAASLACRNREVQQYSTNRLVGLMMGDVVVVVGGDGGGLRSGCRVRWVWYRF